MSLEIRVRFFSIFRITVEIRSKSELKTEKNYAIYALLRNRRSNATTTTTCTILIYF
ncbi:hypothetical protein HanXRQr2_Chr02g0076051 [Helianthus annuus]|uniref:Uncharacterized protein n=1 Tax=Helianthus annuus TaxID=4232 RepID=A0A9K3JQ53_HELAN|nr:hypothetical protein HanXRQr2_Chr02g0076051 [Helianthus annuus]